MLPLQVSLIDLTYLHSLKTLAFASLHKIGFFVRIYMSFKMHRSSVYQTKDPYRVGQSFGGQIETGSHVPAALSKQL